MKVHRYNRLSIVLDKVGLYQKDLAELLGVTKDTVSRWCRNEKQPKLAQLYWMSEFFRVDIEEFLEPTNWKSISGPSPLEEYKANIYKEKTKRKSK